MQSIGSSYMSLNFLSVKRETTMTAVATFTNMV